ncbi:hypothetical protein [Candidatus Tisiphia endosymbiont of Micropterix aruncella]|uniref:hypothetical protein n=1 Tax=Candidatus Tisiphia endosymbiont of Micropterix aruncella TaxID=3066271 RepID=UPI003AA881B8
MLRALELIARYIPSLSYKNLIIILIVPLTMALYCTISFLTHDKTPNLTLWSWHRSDDLLFIDNNTAIASLIATIYIDLDKIKIMPRTNTLTTAANSFIIPVFRLEMQAKGKLNAKSLTDLSNIILSASKPRQLIQLDFDATYNQRKIYSQLIETLVKNNRKISITALSSWCMFDNWIDKLSIEYAVPMVYQGRRENQDIRRVKKFFTDNKNWRSKKCQNYIGLMTDDVLTVPTNFNIFLFNKDKWNKETYYKITKNIQP